MVNGNAENEEDRGRITGELLALWDIPPDLRLGQLICNAVSDWLLSNNRPGSQRDVATALFYLSDDDLLTTTAAFVMKAYPPKDATSA